MHTSSETSLREGRLVLCSRTQQPEDSMDKAGCVPIQMNLTLASKEGRRSRTTHCWSQKGARVQQREGHCMSDGEQ